VSPIFCSRIENDPYVDASALVKRYVAEAGSAQVAEATHAADLVGTALVTRAEVAAALAKAARVRALTRRDALASLEAFRKDWLDLVRIQITEGVVSRAEALAWGSSLRGYDAVQVAAASMWQETLGETVTMATFDRALWQAARDAGLEVLPADLDQRKKLGGSTY